jgi:retron-type reverse transcriptase
MKEAKTSDSMYPGLQRVMERARRNPQERQFALAYLIDVEALRRSYHRLRKKAVVGVDGVTKEEYGRDLETNLQDLYARLKAMKYRHQPIRRIHIPKDKNRTRPIGISATEDKIVQDALREILEAIYEQDFLDCSHGFRPGRRPHDALRSLNQAVRKGGANVILEADIVSFFDTSSHYTPFDEEGWKSGMGFLNTLIRKPLRLPRRTCIASSSPRFTRCNTV